MCIYWRVCDIKFSSLFSLTFLTSASNSIYFFYFVNELNLYFLPISSIINWVINFRAIFLSFPFLSFDLFIRNEDWITFWNKFCWNEKCSSWLNLRERKVYNTQENTENIAVKLEIEYFVVFTRTIPLPTISTHSLSQTNLNVTYKFHSAMLLFLLSEFSSYIFLPTSSFCLTHLLSYSIYLSFLLFLCFTTYSIIRISIFY